MKKFDIDKNGMPFYRYSSSDKALGYYLMDVKNVESCDRNINLYESIKTDGAETICEPFGGFDTFDDLGTVGLLGAGNATNRFVKGDKILIEFMWDKKVPIAEISIDELIALLKEWREFLIEQKDNKPTE